MKIYKNKNQKIKIKNNLDIKLKPNSEDTASLSQSEGPIQTKLDFNVYLDMKKRVIDGYVRFNYICQNLTTKFVILDVNNLNIKKILNSENKELNFEIKKNNENSTGDALIVYSEDICKIKSNEENKKNDLFFDIYYSTNTNNMGIHFSNPNTLHDNRYTFLYTHSEAIYGRSIFPSQDTPSKKVRLTAKILIDEPYTALFSGKLISQKHFVNENNVKQIEFYYEMKDPIPTYLITFIAGKIVKKTISNSRCEVYGEEESLKYVNESFKHCEDYLKFYEKYRKFYLDKMVFIVTPDDFPFSGMENPYATIISESVLSKDASFSSTISHEIAHFWSGNLVTNKNWKSFWLNEGITTYLARKSIRKFNGEDFFEFEMFNGLLKLEHAIEELKKNPKIDESQRSLSPIIKDDPYKSFSRIPYEKGSFFMYYLETMLGEEVLDNILSEYFNKYAFKSLDAEEFISFIKNGILKYFKNKKKSDDDNNDNIPNLIAEDVINKIEWNKWIKGTEKLPVLFNFKSKILSKFKENIDIIKKGDISVNELLEMLKPMRLMEKNRIFKQLIKDFKKLNENAKSLIKKIIKQQDLFDDHRSIKADKIILNTMFINDSNERIEYLKKTLNEFPFYKVGYMKKIFMLIDEKISDKNILKKFFIDIKDRLNPVTFARITELIDVKDKYA